MSLLAATLTPVPQSTTWNTVWVAVVALVHQQIATFLTGAATLALISESIAVARGDARHERLATGVVKGMTYTFAFGAALPIFWVLFIFLGLWGTFFIALTRITFWVFILEAAMFFAEIAVLYTLYANWERLGAYRRARLGLLALLNVVLFWQFFFIDIVASYMLTPNGGDTNQLAQVLNPTSLPLTVHRTIGNIAWAGAVVAGFAALRMRRASPSDRAFLDFVAHWGVVVAFAMTLLQPWVGYSYAKEIQLHAYDAWSLMMFGGLSNVFLAQMTLLGLIFTLGALFFWRRLVASGAQGQRSARNAFLLLAATTVFTAIPARFAWTLDDLQQRHLDRPWWDGGLTNPIGTFIPNKVIALLLLMALGIWALTVYLVALSREQLRWGDATRRIPRVALAMTVTVSLMMAVMGYIRENSRGQYLIYGEMTISGQQTVHDTPRQVQPADLTR